MVKKLIYIIIFILIFTINGYAQDAKDILVKSFYPEVSYKAITNIKTGNKSFSSAYVKVNGYEGYILEIDKNEIFVVKKGETIGININLPKGTLSSLGLSLPKKPDLILKNYNIEPKGEEIVIGRKTYHISLIPICKDTVEEEIWIDKETYIPLKIIIYDWNKRILKEKNITSLTIYEKTPPILKTMEEIIKKNSKRLSKWYKTFEEAERATKMRLLKPEYIPCGYELLGIHASNRFKNTIHILYSNGIGFISLYEKKVPIWARRGKGPHRGPHPNWEKNGIRLLLVGDIKEDVLYKMAKSIK